MQEINPCLWFDGQAEEAARFYASLFPTSSLGKVAYCGEAGAAASGRQKGSVMTMEFELEGLKIMGLNGGPYFTFTPALSFYVWCETENEIDALWRKLVEGGCPRMGLQEYPWAQKYGWTADKYGVDWQLRLSSQESRIVPAFLFVQDLFGKGEEAIHFYMSLFKNSKIESIARDEATQSIMHCRFSLAGQSFVLMEGQGRHDFTFSPAFSFMVNCETQAEIDELWAKLSAGGETGQCGWLKDKYGVSWQVVPAILGELMAEAGKSEQVMRAMLGMTKLDIEKLRRA